MIKNYLELNEDEKALVNDFMNRRQDNKISQKEFEDSINNAVHDFGRGIMFYLDRNKVLGKAFLILEPAQRIHTAYIHNIDLEENRDFVFKELIEKCKEISKKYNVEKLFLSLGKDEILKTQNKAGLKAQYSAFNMELKDKKEKDIARLELEALCEENVEDYVKIFNEAFMDMPHGCFTTLDNMTKEIDNENVRYYLAKEGNCYVGFIDVRIENDKGFFDIGLGKKIPGKGLGKRLLETAIDLLQKKGVHSVCLTVIEKNNIAYDMYKKRGFQVCEKISDWVEIKL